MGESAQWAWQTVTAAWAANEAVVHGLLGLAIAAAIGFLVYLVVFGSLRRLSGHTRTGLDDLVWARGRRPFRVFLPLLAMQTVLPAVRETLDGPLWAWLSRLLSALLAVVVGWILVAVVQAVEDAILSRFALTATDNLRARKVHTQIRILKRIAIFVIALLTLAGILMTYEPVRELGAGILASAGLAGLILGFAAQRTLSNLLAGLQIALTQPIRIDDVVIVEGEWGRVEEITLTYVVVRIWDRRRMVVPISHFLEKPFQNWTRVSADLLGTVVLWTDYTVPVAAVREELHRILLSSELWNGEAWGLQVTDATDRAVQLRALMSAADSSAAWDLRCLVRERLIDFLQREYPASLPRLRATLDGDPGPAPG